MGKGFQPIKNYGVIGNMRSIALVSIEGSIDFLCFPNFGSPTIFAAILDAERGDSFALHPDLEDMRVKQLYLPDTNILLTRFLSESGVAEVTDFMPVVEDKDKDKQRYGHHIIRMLRVIKGQVRFEMHCAPRFNYARSGHKAQRDQGSIYFISDSPDCPSMALHASFPLHVEGADAKAFFTLNAGETATIVFGEGDEKEKALTRVLDPAHVEEHFQETSRFWRAWISRSNYTGRWREMVNRSALVLKLLCSADYGSLIAAGTFGLPEQIGGERNLDYRYTWLRDSAFSLYAFIRLGFVEEARSFAQWIRNRLREDAVHGPLQVMYHADGRQ
jgi:GH15 family glucan-1,4-alpha-glucosidase